MRMPAPEFVSAMARGSVRALAQGTSGAFERAERALPSFPRKRESTGSTERGCRPVRAHYG